MFPFFVLLFLLLALLGLGSPFLLLTLLDLGLPLLLLLSPLFNLTSPGGWVTVGGLGLFADGELGDGWLGMTVCTTVTVRTLYYRRSKRRVK